MTEAPVLRRLGPQARAADVTPAVAVRKRWPLEWFYFSATMIAWSFTPLLRRLIDYHNGFFNPVSIVSLLPFLLVIPLALPCLRKERLARIKGPLRAILLVWLGTFAYGFVISFVFGSPGAATFALVQYVVPAIAGVWVATQDLPAMTLLRRLCIAILPCAFLTALYGLAQWIDPPPWDVLWIEGSGFQSAFNPVPFGMRIFSSLNSPQPAADFWAMTMVLTFPFLRLRNVWTWPLLAALGSALLLTLVREAWVGLVIGVAIYLLLSPRRVSAFPALGIFAVILTVLVTALPAMLGSGPGGDSIATRITTLGDVSHDDSVIARQNEIRDAAEQGFDNPFGSGLGNIGAAARLGVAPASAGTVLDSGYLSRFVELGWAGVLGYLCVTIGGPLYLGYRMFRRSGATAQDLETKVAGAAAIAICLVLAWGDAANDSHYGLDGIFFWLAIGVAIVAASSRRDSAAPDPAREPGRKRARRFA